MFNFLKDITGRPGIIEPSSGIDQIISTAPMRNPYNKEDSPSVHVFLTYRELNEDGAISVEPRTKRITEFTCIDNTPHAFHREILNSIKDIAVSSKSQQIFRRDGEFMHGEFSRIMVAANVAANGIACTTRRGAGNIMITSPEFFDHLVECYITDNKFKLSHITTTAKRFLLRKAEFPKALRIFSELKNCQGFTQQAVLGHNIVIYTTPFFEEYFPNKKALIMYKGASYSDSPISAHITTAGNRICYNMATIDQATTPVDGNGNDSVAAEYSKAENYFRFLE